MRVGNKQFIVSAHIYDINVEDFPRPPKEILEQWDIYPMDDEEEKPIIEKYYQYLVENFPEAINCLDEDGWYDQIGMVLNYFYKGHPSKYDPAAGEIKIKPKSIKIDDAPLSGSKWVDKFIIPEGEHVEDYRRELGRLKTLNFEIIQKFVKIANELDIMGFHDVADKLDEIVVIATEPDYGNEKFEDTNLTIAEVNEIIDRFNEDGPDSVEVVSSGYDPKNLGEGEKITLNFKDGESVIISGHEWDKIQVLLGLM